MRAGARAGWVISQTSKAKFHEPKRRALDTRVSCTAAAVFHSWETCAFDTTRSIHLYDFPIHLPHLPPLVCFHPCQCQVIVGNKAPSSPATYEASSQAQRSIQAVYISFYFIFEHLEEHLFETKPNSKHLSQSVHLSREAFMMTEIREGPWVHVTQWLRPSFTHSKHSHPLRPGTNEPLRVWLR